MRRSIGAIAAAFVLLMTAAEDGAAQIRCNVDPDCDDGIFCNGAEFCFQSGHKSACRSALRGPCTAGQTCNEAADSCQSKCQTDADGDSILSVACGGTDCDDNDANNFPGNPEVCSSSFDEHNEDCDPFTFGNRDADGDRWVSARCCNRDFNGTLRCGPDCNDGDPSIHPANSDVCDLIDNDCDGSVDEGVQQTFYADDDSDGFGAGQAIPACSPEVGLVANDFDCDDANSSIVPGAMVCAGGAAVQTCIDGQFSAASACAFSTPSCAEQPNGTGVCQ